MGAGGDVSARRQVNAPDMATREPCEHITGERNDVFA